MLSDAVTELRVTSLLKHPLHHLLEESEANGFREQQHEQPPSLPRG